MKRARNGIQITKDHIDQMEAAKRSTGCGAAAFLKWADNKPAGLTSTTIYQWMKGNAASANAEQLNFVLENWPKMPGKRQVTMELSAQLRAEEARTGLGPKRLLGTMDEVPKGLKAITISRWMNGDVDTAWCDHVDAVLNAYAKIKSGQ